MKGKAFKLKIVLSMMLVLVTSLCFGLTLTPKTIKEKTTNVVAASTKLELGSTNKEEYSALFDGGVVFSAEKVKVSSEEILYYDFDLMKDAYIPKAVAGKKFLANSKFYKYNYSAVTWHEDCEKLYVVNDNDEYVLNSEYYAAGDLYKENQESVDYYVFVDSYTFKDIQNGTSSKTVIDNGGFVKLDNVYEDEKFIADGDTNHQEALMISFGAYVYNSELNTVNIARNDDKDTDTNDETIHAGITYLDVVVYQNGIKLDKSQVPELRNIRTKDGGAFLDFTYLITQQEDDSNEGYYELNFVYMVNNKVEKATFGFYMINNTSYTQNANDGKDFGYNAKPTLGWVDETNFEKDAASGEYEPYYIGRSGLGKFAADKENSDPTIVSYPTITYDYTKYSLSYVHTANQKNTAYKLDVAYNTTANAKTAKMVNRVTSSGVTTIREYNLNDYQENAVNLVTIMLTEPGTYVINYEFLYDGYVGTTTPDPAFQTKEIKLSVHGLEVSYSKSGVESAKMQYFEIAKANSNHVDLIIPNGCEVSKNTTQKQDKLGFMYTLVDSDAREGNILGKNSIDTLINGYLNNKTIDFNSSETYYNYLIENIADNTKLDKLNTILTSLDNDGMYAKTNQGSLWLEGNDGYTNDSFYFYSPSIFTAEDLFKKDGGGNLTTESSRKTLSNTTTFSSKGYYLVFVEVSPSGMGSASEYWQVFAFQYTSSAVNISIEAVGEDGEKTVVSNGKYTNKEVVVSWEKPGIFDRDVKAYYYSVTNKNLSKEELLLTTKHSLESVEEDGNFVASLGTNVADNNYVRYLIRLESEGESATHKIFTIDKQKITGVQAYLVQELYSGSTVYYSYATDKNGYSIAIPNGITDGYATLDWNDKASAAKIYATYSYTPFSISSDPDDVSKIINGNIGTKWISTNYELGTTIVGADLNKSTSPYLIPSECVLFNQGIYIIDLWDDAGNKCRYSFIIDRTENYFNVEGKCVSNISLLYGEDVNFSIGDYKVFNLKHDSITNQTVKEFIEKASANNLENFGEYYTGSGSNVYEISKLFQKLESNNNYYFTVKNDRVVAYDDDNKIDNRVNVNDRGEGKIEYVETAKNSFRRTIYVVGANHTYTTKDVKTHSYVTIEINKDNARGTVYYSNDDAFENIPTDGSEFEGCIKLMTGHDLKNEAGEVVENGIHGASATSAKHVAFVWNMGTGSFEVQSVTYRFYTLKTQSYQGLTKPANGIYYYAISEGADEPVSLYNNGIWNAALGAELMDDNSGRGIVRFNKTSDTKAGLYVITRTYKEVDGADLGDDIRERNYYFIVDRNGIIEQGIGESIRIELMEGESEFKSFSTQGAEKGVLTTSDGIDGDSYSIYLTTTKLPATLNIPTGKYYTDTNKTSAKYTAGQLNVRVYYYDRYNQLTNQYRGKTIKIYQNDPNVAEQILSDVFNIDIYKYLSNSDYPNALVRDRITESSENGTWLFLPGDYIIRITDNVKNTLGEDHVKYIGLRIATYQDNGPEVEFYSGYAKEDDKMNKLVAENNEATVSQEFLKVVLPAYDKDETRKAQVDKNYIVVDQYFDGVRKDYVQHAYRPDNGVSLTVNSSKVTIEDDKINIWLDTKLRDEFGNIDYANLTKPLHYTITVRYKLNNFDTYKESMKKTELEKYKNCYVYYTTNGVRVDDFYYKTYTITIDREAPKENIEYLNQTDKLVGEYNNKFGLDNMFESGTHKTNSNLYFTNQYAKYYQDGKNKQHIYIYQVGENTPFKIKDIDRVYVKEIADISSLYLNLPVIDTSSYDDTIWAHEFNVENYSALGLYVNRYYEIVEVDSAGNATQYVIFYTNTDANVSIPFSVITTLNETKTITVKSDKVLNENIFKISSNGDVETNTNFIKVVVEKVDGTVLLEQLTDLTTDLNKLSKDIAQVLINEGFGSFNIKLSTQSSSGAAYIRLYNEDIIDSLKTERLVKDANGNYYKNNGKNSIYLLGANKKEIIAGQTVDFYATEITIKTAIQEPTTYIAVTESNGTVKYYEKEFYEDYKDNENALKDHFAVYIALKENTTYLITMKDVFGDVAPYRFNTSGHEFVVVEFEDVDNDAEDDFYHEIDGKNHMYYGFTSATLKYDKAIYTSEVTKKVSRDFEACSLTPKNIDDAYNQYFFEAEEDIKVEYRVKLFYDNPDNPEYTYFITIDTRLSNVSLRDSSTGAEKELIEIFDNVNYQDNLVLSKSDSGRMTLYWNIIEENDYFDYDYRLYEELKDNKGFRKYKLVDGFYVESEDGEVGLNLNGKSSTVIATKEDSLGIYKFAISVYGKDGTYLGNRIYAFMVQEVDTQVYYVVNKSGEEIKANSTFKYSELEPITQQSNEIFFKDLELIVGENVNLPLYITNQEDVVVRKTSLTVQISEPYVIELAQNSLNIYRISKDDAYDIFIGILKIKENSNIVQNVSVDGNQIIEQTSLTVTGTKAKDVVITADKVVPQDGLDGYALNLLAKNKLLLDIIYNGEKVSTQEFNNGYTVPGNGQYSFVFRDLAGNIHEYTQDLDKNTPETPDQLDVYVLREVVVMVNGQAPVNNAFYNEEVKLTIYATSKFETGSISVKATRNGKTYKPSGFNPYVFNHYGTYRVVIKAKYPGLESELSKVLTFTIINVNEATTSIDLTALQSSKITEVLNPTGEPITEKFVKLLTAGGMKISHEDILKYESTASKEDKLNITTGKLTFTIKYLVEDYIYPTREMTIKFTLNNEKATINCSLEKGETTTKGFTISFNEAVIYDQVGESYIYINDKLVAHITDDPLNKEQKISTTFKSSGDGDYYVKLVSSSGIVLDSYKVTIKEPLNTWAIIVIIAVVGVIATVTITIIVLRRKMRIR